MLAPVQHPWPPRPRPAREGVSVTLRQADGAKETYLGGRHCCQCLLQLGLLGCHDFILRKSVRQPVATGQTRYKKRRTFDVSAADACSSSASLTANASFCTELSIVRATNTLNMQYARQRWHSPAHLCRQRLLRLVHNSLVMGTYLFNDIIQNQTHLYTELNAQFQRTWAISCRSLSVSSTSIIKSDSNSL